MKVLIAEDEPDIVEAYKIALEKRSHEVVIAKNGENCVKAYNDAFKRMPRSDGLPFDAVVLDYRMPKKNGMEVAKEILGMNPHQRIIFTSAFVKTTLVESVRELKQIVELLQKPFELDALVDTIEDNDIHGELEKFNLKVRQIKDLDPANKETRELLEALGKIQKNNVWYAIGNTLVG